MIRKILLTLAVLCTLAVIPSYAQQPIAGQPCGAPGASAIATNGQAVQCQGNPLVWTATGGSGSGSGAAISDGKYYLSTSSCGSATNCTQINANGHIVTDATANATTTVTCPNNDCNFTSTDIYGNPMMKVGAKFWGTTQGTGFVFTSIVCPVTTVASFTAQSVVLNAACTGSGTGNVIIHWGNPDGATLHTLDGNGTGCVTINIPSGAIIELDQALFITRPTCMTSGIATNTSVPMRALHAPNGSNVIIDITPDFNWSTATGSCANANGFSAGVAIGCGLAQFNNILVYGSGLNTANNANCGNATNHIVLALTSQAGYMFGSDVAGVCPGTAGEGVELNSLDEQWNEGGAQDSMSVACGVSSKVKTINLDCHNQDVGGSTVGLQVYSGAQQSDDNTFFYGVSIIQGVFSSRNTHFASSTSSNYAIQVQNGGTWTSHDDYVCTDGIGNCTLGVGVLSGGIVQTENTFFHASAGNAIVNSGTVIDLGGNKGLNGADSFGTTATGTWSGAQVLIGRCTGTVTASSTLGVYPLTENTVTTCTSTTTTLGRLMTYSGTIRALYVIVGTGGVNASSGVFTVLKNGATQTQTCTVGTSTTCTDNAHLTTFAVNDIISVQFTTQAADTLANVTVYLFAW